MMNVISFSINNQPYQVYQNEVAPTTSLNEYLRDVVRLKGTKVMCREGGCGICAVTVTIERPVNKQPQTFSINSCLCPLFTVDGWKITTVEGLSDETSGPHPIQKRIADYNGSQCGYCTPAMVMNLYGLLHQNPAPTKEYLEDNLDGNLCRCTGYRSILDAMKSFAIDCGAELPGGSIDIEDLDKKMCPKTNTRCDGKCHELSSHNDSSQWFHPKSYAELSEVVTNHKGNTIRFVFGNTATGVFKEEIRYDVYINLRHIPDLYIFKVAQESVEVGANTTLTDLISLFYKHKTHKTKQGVFNYFQELADHWKKIGNVLLRNAGCWAGNLMMKHSRPNFPSDIFTTLEAVGAKIEILDLLNEKTSKLALTEFLKTSMKNKLIVKMYLYPLSSKAVFRSFKIMSRSQNVYAYVNAGFKFEMDAVENQFVKRPSIVFGGLGSMIHATSTEDYLTNDILTDTCVQASVSTLKKELVVDDESPLLASADYRKQLSINLLYKSLLSLLNKTAEGEDLKRDVSSGKQVYKTVEDEWPLKQPMTKINSILQARGEAVYVDDMPEYKDQLFGALILSTVGNAVIQDMDFTGVKAMAGVVDVVTAADFPEGGVNKYLPPLFPGIDLNLEAISSGGEVGFAGQILGVAVATSQTAADLAATKAKVTYTSAIPPIMTVQDAIKYKSFHHPRLPEKVVGNPKEAMASATVRTSGECELGSQFHFYMENQISLCVPVENGMDIFCSTQSIGHVQNTVANGLNKPANYVNVVVPRVGGSFGGKSLLSVNYVLSCALAAYKTSRPVRMRVKMENAFQSSGKRLPLAAKYEVGHDKDGEIQSVIVDLYVDAGWKAWAVVFVIEILSKLDQGYNIPNWLIRTHLLKTNKPPQTACRSPGTFPAGFVIESIIEQVAHVVKQHPIIVKELNLYQPGQVDINGDKLVHITIPDMWKQIKETAEVDKRLEAVATFNKNNKWKKRGITMTPIKYGFSTFMFRFTCDVAIYASDGSVTVTQGGVELGQGLFTKVTQAVAATLKIPLNKIVVRPNQSFVLPNDFITANSISSEMCVQSAIECCQILKSRMSPVKRESPDLDWKSLCAKCDQQAIELTAKYTNYGCKEKDSHFKYFTYAVGVTEAEVDILTGENQLKRVDILLDAGDSLNPLIDIGQTEGAYVMGLGAMLSENSIYDKKSGKILTDGTWDYNAPTSKDIPVDWRVQLLADSPNPVGVKGSKAVGEPPIVLSTGALFAIRQAVTSHNRDNNHDEYKPTVAPFTVEKIQQFCVSDSTKFIL